MGMTRIQTSNFRTFKDLDINLSNLTVLIGANAAGKTNFLQTIRFLRDIVRHGLRNAISLQGGVEYLRNLSIGDAQPMTMDIEADLSYRLLRRSRDTNPDLVLNVTSFTYGFALRSRPGRDHYEIERDTLRLQCNLQGGTGPGLRRNVTELASGSITVKNSSGSTSVEYDMDPPVHKDQIIPSYLDGEPVDNNALQIETPHWFGASRVSEFLESMSIYDFDPRAAKRASPVVGQADLDENGENLAIVLRNLLEDPEKKRHFTRVLHDVLPFVKNMNVRPFADRSLIVRVRENYGYSRYVPASLVSDGTMSIASLIVALIFTESPLVVLEEPERNIHPHLIARISDLIQDSADNKQIIISTHHPEFVRHLNPTNLLLAKRDTQGFTHITHPLDSKEVQTFIENDVGMADLFIDNILSELP